MTNTEPTGPSEPAATQGTVESTRTAGTVLVGVDGSASSQVALAWALDRAAGTGERVRLVHAVMPAAVTPVVPSATTLPSLADAEVVDRAGRAVLSAALARARETDPRIAVSAQLEIGGAAGALVRASDGAALVVVGAADPTPLGDLLHGSIGSQVAGQAHCPTVVVRRPQAPGGPVVLGVDGPGVDRSGADGSGAADEVTGFAVAEADRLRAPLIAVHAWGRPLPTGVGEAVAEATLDDDSCREAGRRLVAEALEPWRRRFPEVRIEQRLVDGAAPEALLELTESAALLVIGASGHGWLARLLLGSTEGQVLHHSACPVAVVRPGAAAYG
jgi:nucleotide-binding universal stress UspA family protein